MDRVANSAPNITYARDLLEEIRLELGYRDDQRGGVRDLCSALEHVLRELEDRAYACPRCRKIVPGLALVTCNVGMTAQLPFWACDPCIQELEELEDRTPTTIGGYVWGVTLEGPTEGRIDALERRRRAGETATGGHA